MGKHITFDVRNDIGYLTIKHLDALNCSNSELIEELDLIVEQIQQEKAVRVVIIICTGKKPLSTSAELKVREALSENEIRANIRNLGSLFSKIDHLPQPTIAAIDGYAFNSGLELTLACDFRIAVYTTKMGLTELSMAVIPGAGGTQRLPRLIGVAKAMKLILTAQSLSAKQALDYGLLTKAVENKELLRSCEELAAQILKNGPIATQQAKHAIKKGMNVDLDSGLAIEAKAYDLTLSSKDSNEALIALLEKREPKFKGE